MRWLYSSLLYLLTPLVLLYFLFRSLKSPQYRQRWAERFGLFAPPARPGGIHFHAASMGEVNAAEGLIRAALQEFPECPVTVTTFTPTGSERVRTLFGESVFHVYGPLDLPGSVRRFRNRVRAEVMVVLETEIWPNLYRATRNDGSPILIANARISPRSARQYRFFRPLVRQALAGVDRIAAQSGQDAERLIALGAPPALVEVTGNLKFDLRLPPGLREQAEALKTGWGTHRLVLVAGSTHEGEDTILVRVFRELLETYPEALLVLVPRHPERFSRSAQLARAAGLKTALRSEGLSFESGTQCFVVDAMGELLQFYAAGDLAFVGGSLDPIGGHNMLEPAALAKPVVVGPHTAHFDDIIRQLLQAGAARQVPDENGLRDCLDKLMGDAECRDAMGLAGQALVRSGQGALKRTLALMKPVITEATG
jgi:3-deoxy-D-manno-octulosonic-acid transferase